MSKVKLTVVKDGTLFLLYGRKDFEKMTSTRYEYVKGLIAERNSICSLQSDSKK